MLAEVHRDEKTFASRVRETISNLEEQFESDAARRTASATASWNAEQLRKDTADIDYADIVGKDNE